MKKIFVLIFSFLILNLNSQIFTKTQKQWLSTNDDVVHFYGMVAVGELSSGVQKLIFKEQSLPNRLLVDWLVSQVVIFGKETYDKYKANPTGFSGNDIAPGELATHVRIMFKFSIDDFKNRTSKPRKISNKKYILN